MVELGKLVVVASKVNLVLVVGNVVELNASTLHN